MRDGPPEGRNEGRYGQLTPAVVGVPSGNRKHIDEIVQWNVAVP